MLDLNNTEPSSRLMVRNDPMDRLAGWADQVLADGGLTLTESAQWSVEQTVTDMGTVAGSGGTELPQAYESTLWSFVSQLDTMSYDQAQPVLYYATDTKVASVDGLTIPTTVTPGDSFVQQVDRFLTDKGADLSADMTSQLTAVTAVVESVYADGSLSDADVLALSDAADSLQSFLRSDAVKLSDSALTTMTDIANDANALLYFGFTGLDSSETALFQSFATVLDNYDSGTATRNDVNTVMDAMRTEFGDQIFSLAQTDTMHIMTVSPATTFLAMPV